MITISVQLISAIQQLEMLRTHQKIVTITMFAQSTLARHAVEIARARILSATIEMNAQTIGVRQSLAANSIRFPAAAMSIRIAQTTICAHVIAALPITVVSRQLKIAATQQLIATMVSSNISLYYSNVFSLCYIFSNVYFFVYCDATV
jgi:hypothetical protein